MSFKLSFLPRIKVRDKLQQESSVFGVFHISMFLDSYFRGNDDKGGLFWTAFAKKDNLILVL